MAVEYGYSSSEPTHGSDYLWGPIERIVRQREWPDPRVFELGCGNGALLKRLGELGFDARGVDISESGVRLAAENGLKAEIGSAYDDLAGRYGAFPLVISLEVVEHCYDPRAFARTFVSLIKPGGIGIVSTPYHGYLKNLALALSGRMDGHFTALWDGGHIKFFSIKTLDALLREASATDIRFQRVGRVPVLAKSMIACMTR